jgi:hypothetical protein
VVSVARATRRGLLVAGAGLLAAGCGKAEEEPPPDDELLAPSLAAALALASAYERAGGRLGRELAARERDHAQRLRDAGARDGAEAPETPDGPPLQVALSLEQAAMRANVHAVGLVRARGARALTADLLADDARHVVQLRERLGLGGLTTAFPDGRDA